MSASADTLRRAAQLRALLDAMDAPPPVAPKPAPLSEEEILSIAMQGGRPAAPPGRRAHVDYTRIICDECGVTRDVPTGAVRYGGRVCGSVCAGDALDRARELVATMAAAMAAAGLPAPEVPAVLRGQKTC